MISKYSIPIKINASGISCERLDGEMVIISFETGKYFNTNGPAADILYLIEKNIDQSIWFEILSKKFKNFKVETSKIDVFLSKLISEKIVCETELIVLETVELPEDYERLEWIAPTLMIFDDLADLLLIDPIHDTSLQGWPKKTDE